MGSASSVLSTVVDTDNCCTHPCKVVVDGWKVVGIEVVNDIETRGDGQELFDDEWGTEAIVLIDI